MKRLLFGSLAVSLAISVVPQTLLADSFAVNFEPPTYTLGSINGQDGWTSTGSAGAGCAVYDHAVAANTYGYATFGTQSLRISNARTSGCFGDQTFSKSLANEAGEAGATSNGFSAGARQAHFDASFDIASTVPGAQQTGMSMSISPDRGDGSRMSYLRFEDGLTGLDVFFDDVQGTTNPANFVETQIATGLNRALTHRIRFSIDFVNGPSNDVVKIYIDGILVQTGTTWENYYRFDSEAGAEAGPRTTDSLLFRTGGTAVPANDGKGFVFDNLTLSSGEVLVGPPSNKDQCKGDGWKAFNNPTFKNQGQCVSYTNHN